MKDSHGTYDGRKEEPAYECPSCAAALAEKEKAEGALCQMRRVLSTYVPIGEWKNAESALSSSAPCPQAENFRKERAAR